MTALEAVTAPLADLTAALVRLKAALSDHSAESALDEGKHAQHVLLPAMAAVRTSVDTLESVVADDLWPLPTYQETLYKLSRTSSGAGAARLSCCDPHPRTRRSA